MILASMAAPDPVEAARRLTDWGFLVAPDLPDRPGPAYLLVALRAAPTLRHYDPEKVEYWASAEGRGVRRTLSRDSRMPLDAEFSWGLIRVVDRLGVSNEYVTFGGHLAAAVVDGATYAVFASEAPLLRRGGHSQAWDEGADRLAAFFGRLLLAVDIEPGFEARAAAATPLTRYAAFIDDVAGRYRRSAELRERDPRFWTLVRAEVTRLERDHERDWRGRVELQRGF